MDGHEYTVAWIIIVSSAAWLIHFARLLGLLW